jgi:hypothetical protein
MRLPPPIRLALVLVAALPAACGGGAPLGTDGPPLPEVVLSVQAPPGVNLPLVAGDTQVIAADVRRLNGTPLPGVRVSFAVVAGGGRLSAAEAATGADGIARTVFTLGPAAGDNEVEARAEGVAAPVRVRVAALPRPAVSLSPDPVRIAPGCELVLAAAVTDHAGAQLSGISVAFEVVGPQDVVELRYLTSLSGTWRGMRWGVVPRRVGTTRVAATYRGGTDTVAVRVVPQEELAPHHLDAGQDSLYLAVGGTLRPYARVEDAGGCAIPGPQPAFSFASTAPRVAEVAADGTIRALAAGRASVVVAAGALADTIFVQVGG